MQSTAVRPVTWNEVLTEKIKARTARVGIVGLGYVGLPLATEFAKAGFSVCASVPIHFEGMGITPLLVCTLGPDRAYIV